MEVIIIEKDVLGFLIMMGKMINLMKDVMNVLKLKNYVINLNKVLKIFILICWVQILINKLKILLLNLIMKSKKNKG